MGIKCMCTNRTSRKRNTTHWSMINKGNCTLAKGNMNNTMTKLVLILQKTIWMKAAGKDTKRDTKKIENTKER